MAVERRPADRYESDRRVADSTIKVQLDFIAANLHHLRKVDKKGKMERAAQDFQNQLNRNEELTPRQRTYCDGIYEAVMRGIGLPSVSIHVDRKLRGLKFG